MYDLLKEIKDYIKSCQKPKPKPKPDDDDYNPFDFIHKEKIMYLIYKEEKKYKVALRKQTVNILKPSEEEYEWHDINPESMSENPGMKNIIDPPDKALWLCCFYVYPHSSAYGALRYDDRPMKLFKEKQQVEIFIVDYQYKVYDFTTNAKESNNIEDYAQRIKENKVCDITIL